MAFSLGGISLIFILWQLGPSGLFIVASSTYSSWTNYVLITIPLFVLMAQFLSKSGVADSLYESMHKWMGPLKGGLAMGTVVICTVFAAMSGTSAVGTITMGLAALPSMLKRKYDKSLVVGSIAAGGTLGILIPPSIPMILFGFLAKESIGQLFMAGVFPGLILSFLFIAYIGIKCAIKPETGPPIGESFTFVEKLLGLKAVILPIILIILVLGLIYAGVTTQTEAAGIGCLGGLICVLIYRRFSWKMLRESLLDTLRITAMCGWIILGARLFSNIYTGMGASDLMQQLVLGAELNRWIVLIIVQLILLFLGMFMDPIGTMMICVPIFVPLMESMGFNIVWFGILFTINLEMGYITPPFGVNLFYMRSIVPKGVTMLDIYKSIFPFVLLMLLVLALVMAFPKIALWLPQMMTQSQ